MKNIWNKIVKPLLIPALALSMCLKNMDAQKLEFSPGAYIGGGRSKYSNFKIYDGWQKHFKGLNGDEELKYTEKMKFSDFGVGADLGIKFKKFSMGLNTEYSIAAALEDRPLAAIELHNWNFDYAKIQEIALNQKTPSLGVYIKIPFDEYNSIKLKGAFRKVQTTEIKREDPNIHPAAKCAPVPSDNTDDLTKVFEKTKSKTLLNKIGLEYKAKDESEILGLDFYYETDWKKIHEFGLNLSLYFDFGKDH